MGVLDFLRKIPDSKQIKGMLGEWLAKYYAKAMTNGYVLHDVLIDGADGFKSQIDLIIVGNKGIYVVETKMFTDAVVYGDGKKHNWYYYRGSKKYEFYSPLSQNEKHIQYLKKFLKDYDNLKFFSVIVIFCKDIRLSNINTDSNDIKNIVCSSLPAMKEALKFLSHDRPIIMTDEKVIDIYNCIQNNQYAGRKAKYEHIEHVKEFKRTISDLEKQHICPLCGSNLVLKNGKYGKFYGCSGYPRCKFTLNINK